MTNRERLLSIVKTGRDTAGIYWEEINGVFRLHLPAKYDNGRQRNYLEFGNKRDLELVLSLMGGGNE